MTMTAETKWRALIAAQERSGQSVRELARARGLAAGTLHWWRSRLRDRGDLVRVAVVDPTAADDPPGASFELQLGDIVLRVPVGFDGRELRRLRGTLRC